MVLTISSQFAYHKLPQFVESRLGISLFELSYVVFTCSGKVLKRPTATRMFFHIFGYIINIVGQYNPAVIDVVVFCNLCLCKYFVSWLNQNLHTHLPLSLGLHSFTISQSFNHLIRSPVLQRLQQLPLRLRCQLFVNRILLMSFLGVLLLFQYRLILYNYISSFRVSPSRIVVSTLLVF